MSSTWGTLRLDVQGKRMVSQLRLFRYQLKDGDVIHWVYTCDLGNDVGAATLRDLYLPVRNRKAAQKPAPP